MTTYTTPPFEQPIAFQYDSSGAIDTVVRIAKAFTPAKPGIIKSASWFLKYNTWAGALTAHVRLADGNPGTLIATSTGMAPGSYPFSYPLTNADLVPFPGPQQEYIFAFNDPVPAVPILVTLEGPALPPPGQFLNVDVDLADPTFIGLLDRGAGWVPSTSPTFAGTVFIDDGVAGVNTHEYMDDAND